MRSGEIQRIENNCFDILRVLASIFVMFSHAFRWLEVDKPSWLFFTVDGSVGVMMLFAISGFLNMASYDRGVNNGTSFIDFYYKRLLRIYPALIVSYIVIAIMNSCIGINIFSFEYLKYFIKRIILPNGGAFANGFANGVLWTMPCELIYYLLIPVIRKVFTKISTIGSLICILLFWGLNCFDFYLVQFIPMSNAIYFFYEFLIGCFLYCKKDIIIDKIANKKTAISLVVGFSALFWIYTNTNIIPQHGEMHTALFGIIVPFITIIVAFSFGKVRTRYDISYGIYLYHMIVINILLCSGIKSLIVLPIVWLITVIIAIVSYICIEEKALKLKKYLPSKMINRIK